MSSMNAKKFQAALKAQGLSQAVFAREVGISAGGVNRWARGVYPVPKWVEAYLKLRARQCGPPPHLVVEAVNLWRP